MVRRRFQGIHTMADSGGKWAAARKRRLARAGKSMTPRAQPALAPATTKRARPLVGFLDWGVIGRIAESYCADLYNHFMALSARGVIDLAMLGRDPKAAAMPFPPFEKVQATRFDAIISNGIWNHDYLARLAELKIPVISCDHDAIGLPIDSVVLDGMAGGELIGKALIKHGHTDILFVSRFRRDASVVQGADPWIEDPTYMERRSGVQQALIGSQAEFWPVLSWFPTRESEFHAKAELGFERIVKEMGQWPTAIVTPDVGISYAFREVLQSYGLSVPGHVSLVTYHARSPKTSQPGHEGIGISHVEYSFKTMAEHAERLLFDGLAGRPTPRRRHAVPPQFVDEGSLGPRRKDP